jgi:hypothetical protein
VAGIEPHRKVGRDTRLAGAADDLPLVVNLLRVLDGVAAGRISIMRPFCHRKAWNTPGAAPSDPGHAVLDPRRRRARQADHAGQQDEG